MAKTLSTTLTAGLQGTYTNVGTRSSGVESIDISNSVAMGSGFGSGQADQFWTQLRTLAISTTEDLDLAGGLTDMFGSVLTFVKIKGIFVRAAVVNVNDVVVGGAAANAFFGMFNAATDKVKIPPGGHLTFSHPLAGWTVTGGTGDLLRVGNGGAGTTVDYEIAVWGTSA